MVVYVVYVVLCTSAGCFFMLLYLFVLITHMVNIDIISRDRLLYISMTL